MGGSISKTTNQSRNYLLVRSIAFSTITKLFGFFVVFACLPLAALSLTASEYAAFNYSMAATNLLVILFAPVGATFVVRFAHVASKDAELKQMAEDALTIFLTMGIALELPAILGAYWLSPPEFRAGIALSAGAVIATATLSWAEYFRLGTRQDHISSTFGLANNLTIIFGFVALFHYSSLTLERILGIYYFSPLGWAFASFIQVVYSSGLRVRFTPNYSELRRTIALARPNIVNSASDYIKLYGTSFIAFHLSSAQTYAVFSTVQLLVARLTNPLSLIARPLIPAYVDAMARSDLNWIRRLKQATLLLSILGFLSVGLVAGAVLLKPPGEVHLGVVAIGGNELAWYCSIGALLLFSTASLILLASIYLAQHQMGLFSGVCLLSNVAAVLIGGAITAYIGPVAMLAAVAIASTISSLYLTWRFARSFFARRSTS
ncbi:O-antigen/teichoic acid export membrane protein [Bradyrhizobium sp. LB7.2]